MIEKTNCLTFCCHGFQDGRACPVCKGVPQFSDNAATVTRTCESLVGEKGQMNREASAYAKYVGLDAKPEPSLQLLVIDIIGTCLVIAERGGIPKSVFRLPGSFLSDFRYYVDDPFDVVKTAIDGEKPHTRLEKNQTEAEYRYKISWRSDTDYENWTTISDGEYDALSELAGKPLPIYEGGVWKKLLASDSKVGIDIGECVSIWRFTR